MTHLREEFIFFMRYLCCIIYCLPQNSGGKCVLTENIVKLHEIYGAIEQEELRRKKLFNPSTSTINQGRFFVFCPFAKFDLLLERQNLLNKKFMNLPANGKILQLKVYLIWLWKRKKFSGNEGERKKQKLFQFVWKLHIKAKLNFRKRYQESRKKFLSAFI